MKVKSLSRVRLLANPWTAAYQAPPPLHRTLQARVLEWGAIALSIRSYEFTTKKAKYGGYTTELEAVLCLITQLCPTLCNPIVCSLTGSSVLRDSPGKNTGVNCHALLQGIFPTQGSNLGLPHCRQFLYQLSHQGSTRI